MGFISHVGGVVTVIIEAVTINVVWSFFRVFYTFTVTERKKCIVYFGKFSLATLIERHIYIYIYIYIFVHTRAR